MEIVKEVEQDRLDKAESWDGTKRDKALSQYVDEVVACIESQIIEYFQKNPLFKN